MNLAALRAFDAVLSTGGFARAAERLNLSQPAVSAQILGLERMYGVSLFRRGLWVLRLPSSAKRWRRMCAGCWASCATWNISCARPAIWSRGN
ncbi:LysR family transcriptional regulator [Geminicoccus flavidas]|uniref:LysR family transcriptional regulator n=1 Tax=Geminicoccus flavidas TaxID=2506407 RepID=UPI001358C4F0|nr:LysR family transcriptional regulator [Geminicoccus flavidas]